MTYKIATDVDQNEDPSRSTRITKGAEGKVMGMERKRLKTEKKSQRKMNGIERARQAWAQKLRVDSKQRKVHITKRIGTPKAAKKNKANKRCSMQRHTDTILAYRNVLELPSARELRKIICSKRNTKRKIRTGLTDIYFVSYIYRTSLDSEKKEDRLKPTVRSRGGKFLHSKRNLKRKKIVLD